MLLDTITPPLFRQEYFFTLGKYSVAVGLPVGCVVGGSALTAIIAVAAIIPAISRVCLLMFMLSFAVERKKKGGVDENEPRVYGRVPPCRYTPFF